jgi:CTP:molybdopterin cytidylyltransferase MocA
MSDRISAVVLAAGASRRARRPKLLLPYGGTTLLRHAVLSALGSGADETIVVLGAFAPLLRQELEGLPCSIVENAHWNEGMGSSVRCGVSSAQQGNAVLVLLADQPLVTADVAARLITAFRKHPEQAVVSSYAGTLGVPAMFPARLVPELRQLSGDQGARSWIARHRADVVIVDVPEAATDLDSEKDFGLPEDTPSDATAGT